MYSKDQNNPIKDFPDGSFLLHINRESTARAQTRFDPETIENHLKEGFLCLSTMEYDLSGATVPELKSALSSHKLKSSGKKADLISRILTNFTEEEIRVIAPDSYYLLTQKGQAAIEKWQEESREAANREYIERQRERIKKMETFTDLIHAQNFKAAISLMHPGVTSSGVSIYPEAIYRCLKDIGMFDVPNTMATVDYMILGCYLKTVIEDMSHLGYTVNEEDISGIITACYAYAEILSLRSLNCTKYRIRLMGTDHCERCRSMEGRIFDVSEAKVGTTLPPFCKSCHCTVAPVREFFK